MNVFIVSYVGMKVDYDSAVLIKALEKRGIEGYSVSWDDPSVNWSEPDLCIVKSASNYTVNPKHFIQWAKKVEKTTPLWNTSSLLEWNHDKHYLKDLQRKGVPTPPSIFVDRGNKKSLSTILNGYGWTDFVIKPTITAGSAGLKRFTKDYEGAEKYLNELNRKGFIFEFMGDSYPFPPCDLIIQPFIPEIVYGEVSLLYFGGKFSHAVIKKAKAGDFRSHPIWGASVEKYHPNREELMVGEKMLGSIDPTEYARIDMVNSSKGPLIMEIELIEPFLFFDVFPEAAETYADHIENYLNR